MVPPAVCKQDSETCGGKFGCVDEVFVSSSNGSDVRQVSPPYRDSSNNQGCSTAASWSPDGRQLLIERYSSTAPPNLALLTLKTGAVRPLHLPDAGHAATWGKPGIAYVSEHDTRSSTTTEIRLVDPSTGRLKFVIPVETGNGIHPLAWSSRGELATIEGKRIVIYSSTGRKVADFAAPRSREAPASPLVWAPGGTRLLVCLDPFGGLSPKAHQKLVNTAAKRSRYPAPVPYLVNRDGTQWQRFQLPDPQKNESVCSATSWR